MKRLLAVIVILIALAIPTAVFAHTQDVQPTLFYACENAQGKIDVDTITQNDNLLQSGSCVGSDVVVQWSVTGPAGKDGTNGTNGVDGQQGIQGEQGLKGDQGLPGLDGKDGIQGPAGLSGIPFSHAACWEILTGSQQQENRLFCISGIEPDGGLVYKAAIGAASHHIIVGVPISATASVDWSGKAITYVSFTSEYHAECHVDNVVRFYNAANQQVYP